MTDYNLGNLQKIKDLRTVWPNEEADFTPWLAQQENLDLLADTIGGMELELDSTEKNVGPFRADILCKDISETEDSWVLIENQIAKTDHKHLGQLLTYAAGLRAVTIIWVAEEIQEDHKSALNWLNSITDERFRFFGLEVELWKIGESEPAPKFNVVSKPNNWEREASRATRQNSQLSEKEMVWQRYWTGLLNHLEETNTFLTIPKNPSHKWYQKFRAGRTGFTFVGIIRTSHKKITLELYIWGKVKSENKIFFKMLMNEKDSIEKEIGSQLKWELSPDNVKSKIFLELTADPEKESDIEKQHEWFKENLEAFDRAFRERIANLDINNWEEEEEEEEDDIIIY